MRLCSARIELSGVLGNAASAPMLLIDEETECTMEIFSMRESRKF